MRLGTGKIPQIKEEFRKKNLPGTKKPFCRGGEANSCQALAPPLNTVTQGQEEVCKQSPSGQHAPHPGGGMWRSQEVEGGALVLWLALVERVLVLTNFLQNQPSVLQACTFLCPEVGGRQNRCKPGGKQ